VKPAPGKHAPAGRAKAPASPRPSGRPRWSEFGIEALIRVLGFSTVGFVLLIFGFLLREGLPVFFELPAGALLGRLWYPTFGRFGALPLILGSALVTLLAVLIALPLGVAAAVFVREVAPRWAREVLKPLIEVLAGIPSVVLGFFGMTVVAPLVRQWLGAPTGLTAFTGALVLAYMSLPTIISVADDALDAVPRSYRDAGLAMGATRWQTTWRVVVPAGRSGVIIAGMLGMGRAIGETMAVMMVTGNAARLPLDAAALFKPVRTMTATIAAEMGEVARGGVHYHALFGIGILLFVLTFLINLAAARAIFRRRRKGGLR
jgi:phosphate transport system permease protein